MLTIDFYSVSHGCEATVSNRRNSERKEKRFSDRVYPGCLECSLHRELLSGTRAISPPLTPQK